MLVQGYASSGDPDGSVCTEIDECTDNSHDCDADATCTNLPLGSFTCTCNAGYSGTGKGADSCEDLNECDLDLHDCDAFADCTNTVGSWVCACKDGYESALPAPQTATTGDCNNIGKYEL